jgi:hypothetical protein
VVHQIDADGAVPIGHERDLQLRADTVGTRHQHGLFPGSGVEPEKTAKRSDVGEDAGRERSFRNLPDAFDGLVARIDIDA